MGDLRFRHDASARLGVPAHITLLFPFMAAESITAGVLERAQRAMRAIPAFAFRLSHVGRFPGVAYLAPEPADPFVALTRALLAAFPDYPAYGGKHGTVVPHLSVATESDEAAEQAASQLAQWLAENGPVQARCDCVTLLENSQGTWREMHVFALREEGRMDCGPRPQ